jgi:predicted  nucleic acid-binding Zn-ribbon protein
VQDLDLEIARLEHRRQVLPERLELMALGERLADVDARGAEADRQRRELQGRLAELESRVATTEARRQAVEQRMYAARGVPARELQAMQDEARHLEQRRSELEDVELELMVEQDPLDRLIADLVRERSPLEAAAATLRTAAAEADAALDEQLVAARASRAVVAPNLPADLAQRYELLRSRLGGIGAARLIGNRCDGCHLELPAVEVERVRHQPPEAVITCEQCGRLLVRTSQRPAAPQT